MRARGNLTIDLCSNTAAGRKAFISHHAPSHLIQLRLMLHSRFLGAIVKDSLFCAKCLLAFNLFRHRNCSNIVELSFRIINAAKGTFHIMFWIANTPKNQSGSFLDNKHTHYFGFQRKKQKYEKQKSIWEWRCNQFYGYFIRCTNQWRSVFFIFTCCVFFMTEMAWSWWKHVWGERGLDAQFKQNWCDE